MTKCSASGADVDLDRVDVVLGVASTTELVVQMGSRMQRPIWRKALLENGLPEDEADEICQDIADHYVPWQESTFPGLLGNVVAGRVANRLNLGGANFVTDAACAQFAFGAAVGIAPAVSARVGCGADRRRRRTERHDDVHVLLQDAGILGDR